MSKAFSMLQGWNMGLDRPDDGETVLVTRLGVVLSGEYDADRECYHTFRHQNGGQFEDWPAGSIDGWMPYPDPVSV